MANPSTSEPFSLLDYGCGYGALDDYLERRGFHADYVGYDIVEEAVELARKNNAGHARRNFFSDEAQLAPATHDAGSPDRR